jgi:hypothetical protein
MAPANTLPVPTLSKFTLFSELALELRLIVWEMASEDPRVFESTFFYARGQLSWQLLPSEKSPAVLFTCQESRTHLLKQYVPLTEEGRSHPMIQYFNLTKDTIIFPDVLGEDLVCPNGSLIDPISLLASRIPKLRNLVIYDWYHASISMPSLAVFRSLRKLIILSPDGPDNFEEVVYLKVYEEFDSDRGKNFIMKSFWEWRANGLLEAFTELEKLVVGWRAPGLRDGLLVGRNCKPPPDGKPIFDYCAGKGFKLKSLQEDASLASLLE